jgi:two-component system response regulator
MEDWMELTSAAEILLVEDNPRDAEMALRALKKQNIDSGILWLRDGEQALDYVEATGPYAGRAPGHPRVVLLDLKMPKVDGFAVLQRLKGSEKTRGIPVVVLTSSAEQSDLLESYRLMANSYLVKPVHYDNFVESVGLAGVYWTQTNQVP